MERRIPIEELLGHAGWLRGLARGLVQDSGTAEDLVQETWVAALRHPPETGASPRAWLARVLRNLARNARRGSQRRRDREALVAPGSPGPSPASLAEEADAQRVLAEAVSALDEPLRAVIVLRYFRGLDSRAIARELGTPAGTVRWRLGRAREELRAALDRRFEGGRRSWALALGAVLSSRPAAVAGAGSLACSWSAPLLWIAAGAGALFLSLTTLFLLVPGDPRGSTELVEMARAQALKPARAVLTDPFPAEPTRSAVDPSAESTPVTHSHTPAPTSEHVIQGRVLVDGERPHDPVKLLIEFPRGGWVLPAFCEETEPNGAFSLTLPASASTGTLQAPGYVLEDGGSSVLELTRGDSELEVRLASRAVLSGRFLDPASGLPPALGSSPWEGHYELDGLDGANEVKLGGVFRLDDEGRFRIVLEGGGTVQGSLQYERRDLGRRIVSVPTCDRYEGLDLGDLMLEPGRELTFRITDTAGRPIEGAIAKHDDWDKVAQTGRDGTQSLPVVPEDGEGIRFAALRYTDRLQRVRGGEKVEVALERANALDVRLVARDGRALPPLRLCVDGRGSFEEPGVFGNVWGSGITLEPETDDARVFVLLKEGEVLLQHLRPHALVRIEVQDLDGNLLATSDATLGEAEWQELEIVLDP